MYMRHLRLHSLLLVSVLFLAACSRPAQPELAPESDLPAFLVSAEGRVRDAYRFALANPDALKTVPCYCGCGAIGHDSNLACFVQQAPSQGGEAIFDQHGAGCGICVDIAQDVMRLTTDGQQPSVIRTYVDAAYGQLAPGTDTPLP
jgi:hypothetical protein